MALKFAIAESVSVLRMSDLADVLEIGLERSLVLVGKVAIDLGLTKLACVLPV